MYVGTAGRNAEIFGTQTYAPIEMPYMQYGSTSQPIAAITPINTFAAPKMEFGLLQPYYRFDDSFA